MFDIYKELRSEEAYDIKYRFIEKWYKKGKKANEIVEEWLRHIDEYTFGEDIEEMKGANTTQRTPHISIYKDYDLVGELISDHYKIREILKKDYAKGKKVRVGVTSPTTGGFRGVQYEASKDRFTGMDKLILTVIDESMGIKRTKEYGGMPVKNDYLYDMAFYLDKESVPKGKPGTLNNIIASIQNHESSIERNKTYKEGDQR